MPSLLIVQKVTYSVTDSEAGKNYYQQTYGPEEDKKLHKKAMPRETDEESERSVPHHLSKDVRDGHIADRPVEETNSASSQIPAHLTSLSQNIQSIESSSPLYLYEEGEVLYPNYDYSAVWHNSMSPQQQEEQDINLDSDSDFSILMQDPSQQQQQQQDINLEFVQQNVAIPSETDITPTASLQPVSS